MRWRLLHHADASSRPELRAATLLGVTLGLLIGCGLLGLLGIGLVVYFAAWLGDLVERFGESSGRLGMLAGLVIGVGLYLTFWAVAGGTTCRLIASIGKRREKRAA